MIETGASAPRFSPGTSSQSRLLVVNGDDFGFSHGVNRAIITAHREGILSGASLMVTGAAVDEAVELARQNPSLAVGLHLVTVCGRSALAAERVPHLSDTSGRFSDNPVRAGLTYQFNRAARQELVLEIRAQLELFRATGLTLSHVDGHLHMHSHPVVMRILVDLAEEFNIRRIRLPREDLLTELGIDKSRPFSKLAWWFIFSCLARYEGRMLRNAGIGFADRVYGLLSSGEVTEQYLMELIPRMQGNLIEFYCHPSLDLEGEALNGPAGSGRRELEALVSEAVRDSLALNRLQVINFNGVAECAVN